MAESPPQVCGEPLSRLCGLLAEQVGEDLTLRLEVVERVDKGLRPREIRGTAAILADESDGGLDQDLCVGEGLRGGRVGEGALGKAANWSVVMLTS